MGITIVLKIRWHTHVKGSMPNMKSTLNLWKMVVVMGKAAAVVVGGVTVASNWTILLRANHGDYAISQEKRMPATNSVCAEF